MDAYIYQADIYCADCGAAIRRQLAQSFTPADPDDETSYDSDEYPKGPYSDGGGEADSPQHCGSGAECINALEIDGTKVGCWLENPLTSDGAQYVAQAVIDQRKHGRGLVADQWAEWYADEISDLLPADDDDDE